MIHFRCQICRAWVVDRIPSCFAGVCLACVKLMPCWRCGEPVNGFWPYLLCRPCVDVVSPDEIDLVNDLNYQPGRTTWEMEPLGKPQGQVG